MNITNELVKFWQGKITLWKSYWIIGELINAFIIIIILNIELKFFNKIQLLDNIPLLDFSQLQFTNKLILLLCVVVIINNCYFNILKSIL